MTDRPRCERKYLINTAERLVLRQRLSRILRPDPHARGGCYHVRSLYFDDLDSGALFEKLAGNIRRVKWRIRIYNHSDGRVRLERKAKVGQRIRKQAAVISAALAQRLITGTAAMTDDPLVREFVLAQRCHILRPAVVVDYLREPFVHRAGNVRITLDRRLRSGLWSRDLLDPLLQTAPVLHGARQTILEVKFTGLLPEHVSRLLPTTIPLASALSKYVMCRRLMTTRRWEDPDGS